MNYATGNYIKLRSLIGCLLVFVCAQDWVSRDTEVTSRAPLWNPLSTFTTQIH